MPVRPNPTAPAKIPPYNASVANHRESDKKPRYDGSVAKRLANAQNRVLRCQCSQPLKMLFYDRSPAKSTVKNPQPPRRISVTTTTR